MRHAFSCGQPSRGRDQAKVEQPAIGHGAGDRADIVGELRAHQDDRRAVADRADSAPPSRPVTPAAMSCRRDRPPAPRPRRPVRAGSRRPGRNPAPCGRPAARRWRPRSPPPSPPPRNQRMPHPALQQPEQAAGRIAAPRRPPRRCRAIAASARRMQGRESRRGVFRSSHKRRHHRFRHGRLRRAGRPLQRAIEPVQLAPRLGQRRVGELERRAVMRAQQQQPHRLPGRLSSTSRTVLKLPRLLLIFSPATRSIPLCTQCRANTLPGNAQHDCASSFSWCGKIRSCPPACRSKVSPR